MAEAGAASRCRVLWIAGATLGAQSLHHSQIRVGLAAKRSASFRRQPAAEFLYRASPRGIDEARIHRQTQPRRTSKDHAMVRTRTSQPGIRSEERRVGKKC